MRYFMIYVGVLCLTGSYVASKECFKMAQLSLPGAENENKDLNGWKNSGRCSCQEAKKEAQRRNAPGTYMPQCDSKGKFNKLQSWGSTGQSWCANPETGQQITAFASPGKPRPNCAQTVNLTVRCKSMDC
ncbi:saxiphilin-like [Paramacrobiotus metropolitanus]|uniref:saxiphilin-like n=1 Tax=Paramacrobiotus metropolitanus TaxID=2943436 RepID=UPI00244597A5|nr:saxiphilin-like [Paramacrobiotus metropolitanus]